MTDRRYYVYILASKRNGTLYVSITHDLQRRVYEHRTSVEPASFTARYAIHRLMYFEVFDDPETAIRREKRLKEWHRPWKIALIENQNPHWLDLYPSLA